MPVSSKSRSSAFASSRAGSGRPAGPALKLWARTSGHLREREVGAVCQRSRGTLDLLRGPRHDDATGCMAEDAGRCARAHRRACSDGTRGLESAGSRRRAPAAVSTTSSPHDPSHAPASKIPLGVRLRSLRLSLGIKQADAARELGISAAYLNLIEKGKRALPFPLLFRALRHYGA